MSQVVVEKKLQSDKMTIIHGRDFEWLAEYFLPGSIGTGYWTGPAVSGLDIETEVYKRPDGLQAGLFPKNSEIACVQIGIGDLVYVTQPLPGQTLRDVPGVEYLRAYLECDDVLKIIHNAIFEHQWFLEKLGRDLKLAPVWDTQAAEYDLAEARCITDAPGEYLVVRPGRSFAENRKKISLGATVQRYYGVEMDKDMAIRTSFRRDIELSNRQLEYAAFDSWWVQELQRDQKALADEQQLHIMDLDFKMTEAVARMILQGVPVSATALVELYAEWQVKLEALTEEIQTIFYLPEDNQPVLTKTGKHSTKGGVPQYTSLNINSTQQMPERLNKFGIGVSSYAEDDLRHYLDYAGIKEIIEYKKLQKVQSTYVEPFIEFVHPYTGCIHADFQLTTTNTGRPSCAKPNLQNVPVHSALGAQIRKCFQAPPGKKIILADLSNIELRLIAQVFNDPVMKRAFEEGIDLHSLMGSVIEAGVATSDWDTLMALYHPFKARVKQEEADGLESTGTASKLRYNGKTTNFMFGYGAGPQTAMDRAWQMYGLVWTLDYATMLRDMYKTIYAGVGRYHKRMGNNLARATDKYCVESLEGRRKWVDPDTGYSEALNGSIQSTVSEMIKIAHIEVQRDIDIIMAVHDSLMAIADEKDAEGVALYMVDAMQRAGERYLTEVPMKVDYKIVDFWNK